MNSGTYGSNWGVVALTGEYLRFTMGLSNQTNYEWLESWLALEYNYWSDNGQYEDRSGCNGLCNPMPYGKLGYRSSST